MGIADTLIIMTAWVRSRGLIYIIFLPGYHKDQCAQIAITEDWSNFFCGESIISSAWPIIWKPRNKQKQLIRDECSENFDKVNRKVQMMRKLQPYWSAFFTKTETACCFWRNYFRWTNLQSTCCRLLPSQIYVFHGSMVSFIFGFSVESCNIRSLMVFRVLFFKLVSRFENRGIQRP